MSSLWRYALLGFFGAVGVALALCLGLSSHSPVGSHAGEAATSSAATSSAISATKLRMPASLHVAGPVIEHVLPPVALQSPPLETQLAQAPPVPNPGVSAPSGQAPQGDVMEQLRHELERTVQNQKNGGPSVGGVDQLPAPGPAGKSGPPRAKPRITKIPGEGDNDLSIHIQDSDLRDVLELLSEQGGLNILPSPSVQGKVSASLNGVDVDTALDAILRSTGFVAHRDGKFIYVGTPQDFKAMQQSLDKVCTRVYRLNYTRASDIQALVTPLLTAGVGSISVTAPAEEGIADDSTKDGGNKFAGGDAILVHDFVAVLDQVDQVITAVDRKPAQVAIEAMILRVTLDDKYQFGVDFELLRNNLKFATGSPLATLDNFDVSSGGLKFAYLDGSTGAFVSALETIGDTDVIASPKVMVVDKARAEILIGQQLGYVNTTITETSTAQNVQFLEVGAQLRLRPFISSDGLVRMEVHPELSTGEVKVEDGLTLPDKDVTQVTTNIMIPDGCTVVIGGLMREDLGTTSSQVPFFGSLPGIGFLFRDKTETTSKEEIIVLITPHIVCDPDAACEGDKAAAEFHRRQAVYADSMSPLGKRYLGRKYYRLAQAAWARGDQETALRMIDLAVHFDPESRAAIDLRTDIWNGKLADDHTLIKPGMMGPPPGGAPFGRAVPPFEQTPWEAEMALQAPEGPAPQGLLQRREPTPPVNEVRPQQPIDNRQSLPPGQFVPTQPAPNQLMPSQQPQQAPNRTEPAPAFRESSASAKPPLKLAPLGSGVALLAPAAKSQPQQQAPPPATKSVLAADKNVKQASASQVLDGDHLPNWMVDGLMQPGGPPPRGNAAQSNANSPARLSPMEARPITPQGDK